MIEGINKDELEKDVERRMTEMVSRFQEWLDNSELNMKQFAEHTGLQYPRIFRMSKQQKVPLDILLTVMLIDPQVSKSWLLALEDTDNDAALLSYNPSFPADANSDALRRKLAQSEKVILALQKRLITFREEAEASAEQQASTAQQVPDMSPVIEVFRDFASKLEGIELSKK